MKPKITIEIFDDIPDDRPRLTNEYWIDGTVAIAQKSAVDKKICISEVAQGFVIITIQQTDVQHARSF